MFKLLVLALFAISFTNINAQKKVKLSVYYETLCPDSIRFFRNQLKTAYDKISPYFDSVFIPYGNAERTKENNKWVFKCQHGKPECVGNKLHACALAHQNDQSKIVELLVCSMTSTNPASAAILKKCTEQIGVSFDPIDRCFQTSEAGELLAKYGELTDAVTPNISYIPTIIINDVYNQTIQENAESNLVSTICNALEYQPAECDASIDN